MSERCERIDGGIDGVNRRSGSGKRNETGERLTGWRLTGWRADWFVIRRDAESG